VASYLLGRFLSGTFAVLLALGSGGIGTALAMAGVVILANSVLENLARPLTFGAVLSAAPTGGPAGHTGRWSRRHDRGHRTADP
jgi:putative heme transporter